MRDVIDKANARAKLKRAGTHPSENKRYQREGEADERDGIVLDEVVHAGKGFARRAKRATRLPTIG